VAEWVALGDRAIRFARPPGVSSRALVTTVRTWSGAIDVVVTRDDVAVYFAGPPHVTARDIAALATLPDDAAPAREHVLRVVYDGPDLAGVAEAIGTTIDEVIAVHAAGEYTVETMGFLPGFAYMTGVDPRLALPRRATPRTRVPAGAVAIAGGYTSVYPLASPGGWHLLGHTEVVMFGPDGALLGLGDRVRFAR